MQGEDQLVLKYGGTLTLICPPSTLRYTYNKTSLLFSGYSVVHAKNTLSRSKKQSDTDTIPPHTHCSHLNMHRIAEMLLTALGALEG